jgi:site-specific recombinase XerD
MNATKNYIHDFLDEESLKPVLWTSIKNLESKLKKLGNYLNDNELEAHELGVKQAQSFQGWLTEENTKLGRNTIATLVIAAARFYEYLKKRKIVPTNPFSEIKRVKLDAGIPKNILSPKDVNRLLEELADFSKGKDFYEKVRLYRLHVLAELLYSTGIRISEASGLKESDIDIERGTVQVYDRKSKRKRVCFLNEYAKGVMKIYLEKMRKWIFFANNYRNGKLFGAAGNRLSIALNEELKMACEKLKLTVITSHSFRHMVGSHLLKAGCDLRYIQELLGHERLRSTQVYTRVEKEDLRAVLDTCHPRQFKSIEHEQVRAV